MKIRNNSKTLIAMGTLCLFILSSCSKYEDGPALSIRTKTARLTGEWEVIEIDGENVEDAMISEMEEEYGSSFDVEISGFKQSFEIEKGGDITMISEGTISISSEYYSSEIDLDDKEKGDWEWTDDKDGIEVDFDGYDTEFEILRLTNKELIFEDEDGVEYTCEKI